MMQEIFDKLDTIYKEEGSDCYFDEDGYPTETILEWIALFPYDRPVEELLNVVYQLWDYKDYTFKVEEVERLRKNVLYLHISTFGYSGNKSIIEALKKNFTFWAVHWYSSTRGDHYVFQFSEEEGNKIKEVL